MTHQLEDFAQKDGQGSERPKPGLRHPLTLDVRDGVEPPRGWLALALLCAAQFMVVLDFSIVNVALPSMQKSLGFSPTTLQWVVSAYSLLFGGFLLLGGRAADLFGRRRVFLLGLVLFTLASLGGGFAQSPLELIVARASQGLAASIVAPSVLSLITTTFPQGAGRNRALGTFGAVASAGFASGVILGGLLTSAFGWRWVLFVNVPIGLTIIALTPLLLPESRGAKKRLDLPGSAAVTLALAVLIYALSQANAAGWGSLQTIGSLVLAALLLVAFLSLEARTRDPLVRLSIFRLRTLTGADTCGLLFGASLGPTLFILTLYLQNVLGYSPVLTGFAFLPHALIVTFTTNLVSRLTTRLGVKPGMVTGAVVLAVGLFWLSRMSAHDQYWAIILPGTLLVGLGVAFQIVTVAIAATEGVADDEQGLASGLFNTSQQVGSALGVAILVAVASARTVALSTGSGGPGGSAALVGGFQSALLTAVGFAILSVVVSLLVVREVRLTRSKTSV
jgi:EmrB/QacA subfamily drug resistance transporter